MLYLHEMELLLGTKNIDLPKTDWTDIGSQLLSTVTVTYGTFLKRRANFGNMPLSKNLESRLTVSVLRAVDVNLAEKKVLWLFQNIFLRKLPNYSRVRYKYSLLRYGLLFKINGIENLFGWSSWVGFLRFSFEWWRQIGASEFCMHNIK